MTPRLLQRRLSKSKRSYQRPLGHSYLLGHTQTVLSRHYTQRCRHQSWLQSRVSEFNKLKSYGHKPFLSSSIPFIAMQSRCVVGHRFVDEYISLHSDGSAEGCLSLFEKDATLTNVLLSLMLWSRVLSKPESKWKIH